MGFFGLFSKSAGRAPALRSEYTLTDLFSDTVVDSFVLADNFIFHYANDIYALLNYYFSELGRASEANDEAAADDARSKCHSLMFDVIETLPYEEEISANNIAIFVGNAVVDNMLPLIEGIQEANGDSSRQYFAGMTLDRDRMVNALTNEVLQIVQRDYHLYLRNYFAALDGVRRYKSVINSMDNDSGVGDFIGGAGIGIGFVVNPLLGAGLLAKRLYDAHTKDKNQNQILEDFSGAVGKFLEAGDTLARAQQSTVERIASLMRDKLNMAAREISMAVDAYQRETRFAIDVSSICRGILDDKIQENDSAILEFLNSPDRDDHESYGHLIFSCMEDIAGHDDTTPMYKERIQNICNKYGQYFN